MTHTLKHHITIIVALLGLVGCMAKYGYEVHQLFLGNSTELLVELAQEEAPESDTEESTDSLETGVEKDKLPSANQNISYLAHRAKLVANRKVLQHFGTISIELNTPPPEYSL